MNLFGRLWVIGGAIAGITGLALIQLPISAQEGAEATVAALQTEVAVLSTTVASQSQIESSEAQGVATPGAGGENVLYEADWSGDGLTGWFGSDNWSVVNGMLVSSGATGDGWFTIFAPYNPAPSTDYAVEAEIQFIRSPVALCTGLGPVARFVGDEGIRSGIIGLEDCDPSAVIWAGRDKIAEVSYDPGDEWRTYRLEVSGTSIRLLIDGFPVLETSDSRYMESGRVGLHGSALVHVRSFKVLSLDDSS